MKFDILDSMAQLKFLHEVVMTKYWSHTHDHFKPNSTEGLEMSLNVSN